MSLSMSELVPECCSMNLTLHDSPRDSVKMLDSGSIVTSLSAWSGRKLSQPSYLLTRHEFMIGTFLCPGCCLWYSSVWRVLILSSIGLRMSGMVGVSLQALDPL